MKVITTKKPMVLVIHTNKNNKLEYRVCKDMDTANLLFPKDQKQTIQCYHAIKINTDNIDIGHYVKIINPKFSTFGKVGKVVSIRENNYTVSFNEPICGDMTYEGRFFKEDLEKVRY
jgi:hypothetical protein